MRVAFSIAKRTIKMVVIGGAAFTALCFSGGYLIGQTMGRSVAPEVDPPQAAKPTPPKPSPLPKLIENPSPIEKPEAKPDPKPEVEQAPEAPVRKPTVLSKAPAGRYGLQLGAYEDEEEARSFIDDHAAELLSHKVFLLTKHIKNKGTWHRIRLGTYRSKRAAERGKRKLSKALRATAIVVRHR